MSVYKTNNWSLGHLFKMKVLTTKLNKVQLLALLALMNFLVGGCGIQNQNKKVSHEVWLPWPNEVGAFTIQKVSVETLTNWSPLRGTAAKIQSHGRVSGNTLSSQEVALEYTHDRSGVVIPLTPFSTEVASIYAHFEKLQKIDKELGVPDSEVARKVYVKFLLRDSEDQKMINNAFYVLENDSFFIVPYENKKLPLSVNGPVLAHEHFHSIFARILLRPLLKAGEAKGRKVLSVSEPHETSSVVQFFHNNDASHFQQNKPISRLESVMLKKVGKENLGKIDYSKQQSKQSSAQPVNKINPTPNSSEKLNQHLNLVLLMALNEGLADVWAWLYGHNPCFIQPSLDLPVDGKDPESLSNRCLSNSSKPIVQKDISQLGNRSGEGDELQQIRFKGYRLGTNLARLLYQRFEERGELKSPEAIAIWQRHIVQSLPLILTEMMKVFVDSEVGSSLLPWDKILDQILFGAGSPSLPQGNCEKWKKILINSQKFELLQKNCNSNVGSNESP